MPFDKPRRQAEAEAEDVAPTFHSGLGVGREGKGVRGGEASAIVA